MTQVRDHRSVRAHVNSFAKRLDLFEHGPICMANMLRRQSRLDAVTGP